MDNTEEAAVDILIWRAEGVGLVRTVDGLWPYDLIMDGGDTSCLLSTEEIIALRDALNRLEL